MSLKSYVYQNVHWNRIFCFAFFYLLQPPTIINLPMSCEIPEDTLTETLLYTVSVTDPTNDTVTCSITTVTSVFYIQIGSTQFGKGFYNILLDFKPGQYKQCHQWCRSCLPLLYHTSLLWFYGWGLCCLYTICLCSPSSRDSNFISRKV